MYLSQLLKSPVADSSDAVIGRLNDILIEPINGGYAPLKFLVVAGRGRTREPLYIPYEFVANMSHEDIALKHLRTTIPAGAPANGLVRLVRDILDQQIVDVEGARVVRVNDLKLGVVDNVMSVIGLDVSWRGVLRRLGLSRFDFLNVFKVNLIDWRKAEPIRGVLKLNTISKDISTLHPADLANIIEDLNIKHGSLLVGSLDSKMAAKVVEEMKPEIQQLVMRYLGPERAAKIMERMSIDEAVDLLQQLPREEGKKFLSYLQQTRLQEMERLLPYAKDTAGGMMTLDYMSARPEWTVKETVEEVKRVSPRLRSLLYVYVTDEAGKFKGAVSLRRLVTADPDVPLKSIMKKLPKNSTLKVADPVDKVGRLMTKYNLYTAAVLERDHKLVGILTIDDVMRHLVPNA